MFHLDHNRVSLQVSSYVPYILDRVDFDTDEGMLSTVPLNITKLKEEDYGSNFVCHAGETAAYFLIQRPSKSSTVINKNI